MKEENKKIELLNPKSDYVFKRIFGHVGNEEITCDLLNSILENKITEIELDKNPILEKDLLDDKIGILDIKAKADNNVNINIEMQVLDQKNIEKRLLYYWSKMYTQTIKQGEDYEKLEKSIVILFSNYELESLKDIKKYITQWNIREKENKEVVLTNVFEIYIIELKKYQKDTINKKLDTWVKFLENPEVVTMKEDNKAVQKAKKVLEEISQDERERYLAELRQKYIMDQKAMIDAGYDKGLDKGLKQGLEEGLKQGLEQGLEKGIKKEKIEIAKKMKIKNILIEEIIEITGLTKEEIKNL